MSKEWLLCQAPAKEQNLRAPKTMSNLPEQTLEEQTPPVTNQNPNDNNSNNNEQKEVQVQRDQSQEWETMARAWVSAFPEAKAVSSSQVDAWIDSNYSSLPADLQSMPRSELIDRLLSIQHYMKLPNEVPYSLSLSLLTIFVISWICICVEAKRGDFGRNAGEIPTDWSVDTGLCLVRKFGSRWSRQIQRYFRLVKRQPAG